MRAIPLTQGKVALVDDADYDYLMQWKWNAGRVNKAWYAQRRLPGPKKGKQKYIRMHVQLMNPPAGLTVDHEDGDGLNNQRYNLRIATRGQNNQAFRRKAEGKLSKYRGVSRYKGSQKWFGQVEFNGKGYNVGTFDTEEEAAIARDRKALELFGRFAHLNFPELLVEKLAA